MTNICIGCGERLRTTTVADKKSARIICDKCYNKINYHKSLYKATITLHKAQMLEGVKKNFIDVIFNNFLEIDYILKENNIEKDNLWSIDFR